MTNLGSDPVREPRWPAAWARALLPSAILACVEEAPLHGYAIGQALGARGFGVPRGGSLYPALARLEESGVIAAEWVPGPSGPARRQYTLTRAGRDQLARDRITLGALTVALDAAPPDSPGPPAAGTSQTSPALACDTGTDDAPGHRTAAMAEGVTDDL